MLSNRIKRVLTIDILRALTMFLMVFVNDIWSLTDIPKWLGHTLAEEDGMGFSDIIFPLFLFIVGLSIPMAIGVRRERGDKNITVIRHVVFRTIALLIMGVYMVNLGKINSDELMISKYLWQFLMALGIFLIWLNYKIVPKISKRTIQILQATGVFILVFLAAIYKGGTAEHPLWMQVHWWGILGLIGWAYFFNALYYLYAGKKLLPLFIAFLILNLLNLQEFNYFEGLPSFKLVISASNHVLVLSGVLCTSLYLKYKRMGAEKTFLGIVFVLALILILYGFWIRPTIGISKILASPSWTTICIGISFLSYILVYILVEIYGFTKWSNPIQPAGTSTLTCYLMPYFIYPLIAASGLSLPFFLTNGAIGILKSLTFAFIIVSITGGLERLHLKLKI